MQVQATQIIHAYKQAPWRVQRQWIGAFLLILVGMAMIAALYLDVTARAAVAGREIQELQFELTAAERANADLETQLADLTSTTVMQQRALELGYRPVKPGEIDYVSVPGYVAPEPTMLMPSDDRLPPVHILPTEYTQSLLEWIDQRVKFGDIRP